MVMILILFSLILIINIHFHVHVTFNKEKKLCRVFLYFFKWKIYKKDIPLAGLFEAFILKIYELLLYSADHTPTKQSPEVSEEKSHPEWNKAWRKRVFNLLSSVKLRELEWHSKIGFSEAHYTAISTGILYQWKLVLLNALGRGPTFITTPSIKVTPEYNQFLLETEFLCIGSARLGQIIQKGLMLKQLIQNESRRNSHAGTPNS